jgi:phospholipid/cholesterol/gamma-HCH transport system substrate-binding protein
MESQKHYAMIGAFIVLTGASFIGVSLWLAFGDISKGFRTYLAYMEESVSGLYVDAPVRYQGVEVGRVTELDLDTENPQRVRITLAIESRIRIAEDTVATLAFQGLTGIASVELSGGTNDAPRLRPGEGEEYPVLKTGPSLFTRFDTVISELIANMNRVAEGVHTLMSPDNFGNTEKILANVEIVTGTLAGQGKRLEQSARDLARMMANGAQASAQLPGLVAGLNRGTAVVQTSTPVAADLRLDLDLAELYQDFSSQPGSVHLSLRAQLLDMNRPRVLATRQFDYAVSLEAGNAASGVEALNTSLQEFLPELAKFCIDKGFYQPVDRRSRRGD